MKNVIIIYHYIAHYRVPFFRLLSQSKDPKYTLCSGIKTDINIATADIKLSKTSLKDGGLRWRFVKNIWFARIFLIQLGVLRICLSRKYDTVVFLGVMYFLSTWLGAILARLTGKKVVFWTHGFIKEEENLKGSIRAIFYKLAHEIVVYGQRAKDIMVSKGFDKDKIKLIYNSLDYDTQIAIRNRPIKKNIEVHFKNESLPIFGFIGRLTPQKKIGMLIESLSFINKNGPRANLLIIGSGEKMNDLKQMVVEADLKDHVYFYGSCYEEEIIFQLLSKTKLIVSPGEVGLTAIHALTYGIPVVTHNRFDMQMPEYEVIMPGVTGDFFEHESVSSLTGVIEKWLFKKDESTVQQQCYKVIDEFYNPYVQKKILDKIV